jgi:hypothetical protein
MRGATTEDIGDKRPDDSSSLHPCPSPTICVAIMTAEEKLKQLGRYLPAPHSRAVEGKEGRGLRELRPRVVRVVGIPFPDRSAQKTL